MINVVLPAPLVYTKELGNNPRKTQDVIISFVIFNKKILNLFSLDIGSVLSFFFGF